MSLLLYPDDLPASLLLVVLRTQYQTAALWEVLDQLLLHCQDKSFSKLAASFSQNSLGILTQARRLSGGYIYVLGGSPPPPSRIWLGKVSTIFLSGSRAGARCSEQALCIVAQWILTTARGTYQYFVCVLSSYISSMSLRQQWASTKLICYSPHPGVAAGGSQALEEQVHGKATDLRPSSATDLRPSSPAKVIQDLMQDFVPS